MIEVSHLRKEFGSLVAVDDLSFEVAPGEVLGFLGPNGAGKSTTMKILTGFLTPTSGQVRVCGSDIEADTLKAQRQIGYLPEGAPLYEEMTALGFLEFVAEARGLSGKEKQQGITQVIDTMSLQPVLDQRVETLSKGFKRRLGLAQAIIHDPVVLILDEPTDGLDPNQKHQVRKMISGLSKDKIVIISTHILEEVEAVCSRAMIISNGKMVADCHPAELEAQSKYHGAVTVQLKEPASARAVADRIMSLDDVQDVQIADDSSEVTAFPVRADSPVLMQVSDLVREENWEVKAVFQEKGRLDEVFRKVTEGEAA